MIGINRIYLGDVLQVLQTLESESVNCCVTSPPYWGLRDYGVEGQLGLEKTPEEYTSKMVEVFREVRRVLRKDGVMFLNIGDSHASDTKGSGGPSLMQDGNRGSRYESRKFNHGLKPKDLVGIPWMVAFALRQPYENALIKDRVDRAWFAGIIDGEGCITSNEVPTNFNPSYPIILQVRMSDRQALEKIVEITKVSKVQDEHLSPSQIGSLQRPPSVWKTSGDNAMNLLAECYPFLTVKKKQALVAWNLQKLKDGIETRRGVTIPIENMEKRKHLYLIIRDLNQRRSVDIPSWLEKPVIKIEPGWYLRSDVIWAKPNPMPESVTDRPTKAHEYLFLMAKSERYYYDAEAIKEPAIYYDIDPRPSALVRARELGYDTKEQKIPRPNKSQIFSRDYPERAKESKFSTPLKNIPLGQARLGAYRDKQRGHNRRHAGFNDRWDKMTKEEQCSAMRNKRSVWTIPTHPFPEAHFATFPEDLIEPCIRAGSKEGDIVLDPFMGAGTTAIVSLKLGRKYIGIELNPKYIQIAEDRINNNVGLLKAMG